VNEVADARHSGQLDIFPMTGLLFQADTDHEATSFGLIRSADSHRTRRRDSTGQHRGMAPVSPRAQLRIPTPRRDRAVLRRANHQPISWPATTAAPNAASNQKKWATKPHRQLKQNCLRAPSATACPSSIFYAGRKIEQKRL
jgi:hypothetical protein